MSSGNSSSIPGSTQTGQSTVLSPTARSPAVGASDAGSRPPSVNPSKSPEVRASPAGGSSAYGGGLDREKDKPRTGLFGSVSDSQRPGDTSAAAAPRPGVTAPPHHHHHHHHHVHGPQATSSASQPAKEGEAKAPPSSTPTSLMGVRPPAGTGFGSRWGTGYGSLFGGRESDFAERELMRERERQRVMELERQRERERERERQAQRDRERKAALGGGPERSPEVRQTSASSLTSPYPRPSLPPSPPVSRSLPAPTPGQPVPASGMSPRDNKTTSTTPGGRPNLPVPGFPSLGTRSLPSPFDRDRASATPASETSAQNAARGRLSPPAARTDNLYGRGSPEKATTLPGGSTSRGLFGGPPSLSQNREKERTTGEPSRSPLASPGSANKASTGTMGAGGAASTGSSLPTYGYPHIYSHVGTAFGATPGYQGTWYDRERLRAQREKEAKERELREKQEVEKWKVQRAQEAERKQKEQIERQKARQATYAAGNIGNAPTETKPYGQVRTGPSYDPFGRTSTYERPSQTLGAAAESRIEVLNAPSGDSLHSNAAQPYRSERESIMQQVAPSREPRPYTYSGKPDTSQSLAALAKEREYHYTPRDKRPRMDAAVEDQANRRGTAQKTKRRKEEEKLKSPLQSHHPNALPLRDYSSLTREIRTWPMVSSTQIESWVKSLPDPDVVISRHVFDREHWCLSRVQRLQQSDEGAIVTVRINQGFLGTDWVVRGEPGWDESTSDPPMDTAMGEGKDQRKIWGTDIYTDDSDLGLVLVHAGWLRWSPASVKMEQDQKPSLDQEEYIEVKIRVAPQLVRYVPTERNGITTRGWGNGHDGLSIAVEDVKRNTVTRKKLRTRTSRKLRMAEYARQRCAVDEFWSGRASHESSIKFNNHPSPWSWFDYDHDWLSQNWASRPESPEDEVEEDDASAAVKRATTSIFTRTLELSNSVTRYGIKLIDPNSGSAEPVRLTVSASKVEGLGRSNDLNGTKKIVGDGEWSEELGIEDIMFVPEGLILRIKGEEGVLCKVEAMRWRKVDIGA